VIRKIRISLFGIIIAIALIYAVELLGHHIYPPPAGIDLADSAAMRRLLADAPAGALWFEILAYIVAIFGGGMLAALIARERPQFYVLVVGAFVLSGSLLNQFMIPHPGWFVFAAATAIIAMIFLTARLAASLVGEPN